MTYSERFTAAELENIINVGVIYMCACPAMVADSVRKLREMYRYQLNCLEDPQNCSIVHQSIARNTAIAHARRFRDDIYYADQVFTQRLGRLNPYPGERSR